MTNQLQKCQKIDTDQNPRVEETPSDDEKNSRKRPAEDNDIEPRKY